MTRAKAQGRDIAPDDSKTCPFASDYDSDIHVNFTMLSPIWVDWIGAFLPQAACTKYYPSVICISENYMFCSFNYMFCTAL